MNDSINAHDHPPHIITEPIKEFCRDIVPDSEPVYVEYAPIDNALKRECFDNVNAVVAQQGGSRLLGWSIGIRFGFILGAEAHAIWVTPNGEWRDITPQDYVTDRTLFVPDSQLQYTGRSIATKFRVLINTEEGRLLESAFDEMEQCLLAYRDMPVETPQWMQNELMNRSRAVYEQVNKSLNNIKHTIGRNAQCPCGSGRKYKKCCGA